MFDDFRYAFRMFLKNPRFTAVAVLSLGIGIGANSGIYSLADALLLRPLPVLKPSEILTISRESTGTFAAASSISYPEYRDLRDQNRTFDGLSAFAYTSVGFTKDRALQPKVKFGMAVSGNFFHVFGVEPVVGRGFAASEDVVAGRDAVVVISHDLWLQEYDASPAAVGRTVRLNGLDFTIIGVAPEKFTSLGRVKPALYLPIAMLPNLTQTNNLENREARWLDVKGRLKRGVGMNQAKADIATVAENLRRTYSAVDEHLELKVGTELQVRAQRSPPDAALIAMLSALAVCVLLVACANVAGLLLSRASARAREISLRQALGANRSTLIKQLMIENCLLAIGGGATGLAVALLAVRFFRAIPIPTDVPLDFHIDLDNRALLFTMCVSIISTLFFGLVPALQSTKLNLISSLNERNATTSNPSRLWGRSLIVTAQVALSLVLLIISAVLIQGFRAQLDRGPGFRIAGLQTISFDPGLARYTDEKRVFFYKQLLERTQHAAGVKSAVLASNIPLGVTGIGTIGVVSEGHPLKRGEHAVETFDSLVTPGYFKIMAIPIVQGREFQESDRSNAPGVAIVNEQFARHYWPNQNAIGRRIYLSEESAPPVVVVGVAEAAKYLWITEGPTDFIYLPFAQHDQAPMTLIAQSNSGNATSLVTVLRQVVAGLDRDMPVFDVRTVESLYESRAIATPALVTQSITVMGIMGLILALIGLYGTVSYSVSRRSREFGVRMAVGADRWRIVKLVLRQGLLMALAGVGAGLLIGIFAAQAITSTLLFSFPVGVMPFVAVSALLLMAVLLSAYLPARRASLIDPIRALREE